MASSTTAAYSITVTDTGESSVAAGTPTQTLTHGAGSQIQVTWQADDPDGDRLVYSLYFRGEDEKEWKLLRANMSENSHAAGWRHPGRRALFFPRGGFRPAFERR